MRIDVLYFDGCPSWKGAIGNLREALSLEGREAEIRPVRVADDVEAARLKFLGSPSFQVDGADWWPESRSRYYLSCRLYRTPLGIRGEPTVDMLREKIRAFSEQAPPADSGGL